MRKSRVRTYMLSDLQGARKRKAHGMALYGEVTSSGGVRMPVVRLRATQRRRVLYGSIAVLVGVGAGSPWWFGWFGGPSSNRFVTGPVPGAKGVFKPGTIDEQRAAVAAKILGPGYQIVSVSKYFVDNNPEVPGALTTMFPANGASPYGSGTNVILDSATARIDVGLGPIEPPVAIGFDHVVSVTGGGLGAIEVGGSAEVTVTEYALGSKLPFTRTGLSSLEHTLWTYYTTGEPPGTANSGKASTPR